MRDGRVLVNPAYDPDLCVIYLSHIFMLPEARGTVLTYWLRIAPIDLAVTYLHRSTNAGGSCCPRPMRRAATSACASISPPRSSTSARRTSSRSSASLFYGRGGFDAIDPRHFPYRQPDFRPAADDRRDRRPRRVPFMLLLRRVGREREARLPIDEARAVMQPALRRLRDVLRADSISPRSLDVVLDAPR